MEKPDPVITLGEVAEEISRCRSCRLSEKRSRPVPGEGPPGWIVLVGEAPGANEDLEGRPFVGAAGRFLDELLGEAGLSRSGIFITNVVKCRPPSNRVPRSDEIRACEGYLRAQLEAIGPKLLCTMGAVSTRSLLGISGITRARGTPVIWNGIVSLPVLHPAASLYDANLREVLRADFQLLGELAGGGPEGVQERFARIKGIRTLDSFG